MRLLSSMSLCASSSCIVARTRDVSQCQCSNERMNIEWERVKEQKRWRCFLRFSSYFVLLLMNIVENWICDTCACVSVFEPYTITITEAKQQWKWIEEGCMLLARFALKTKWIAMFLLFSCTFWFFCDLINLWKI